MGAVGDNCGMKTARAVLFIFNIVFIFMGLLLIGIGIWMRVDQRIFLLLQAATATLNADYPAIAAYIFIAVGGFILIVAIFGCCGVARKSYTMLALYIVFVIITLFGEIAAGVIAMIGIQKIDNVISRAFQTQLTSSNIQPQLSNNQSLGPIMNWCQLSFSCCGYYGPLDYNSSALSVFDETYPVPPTCCSSFSGDPWNANYSMVGNWSLCRDEALQWRGGHDLFTPSLLYTDGCQYAIELWVLEKAAILVGIALGTASLELFILIYAFCLCMMTRETS